ncbi:putative disease resistance protein RGA3 isoform X1 [Spinacia oleracea]|uniref:Disease resistance protein RGA3 isoform X1 n=1 Tax=Spinacia oleracea TaxID=3562 RepID=A0ABM3RSN2_SPIOL|nr:putative disease resistance protein RGA3 isoform X1 [Spinacia oleracea]
MHELKGLSDEDSWCLFERIAFNQGSKQVDDALVVVGKNIVKKCANVPLSIRVIGSMLYDQDKSKWLSFQEIDLAKIRQGEDGIMQILKFSYYHLTRELKTCFSYCALFPKDYEIRKEFLINLWLAEGCLECPKKIRNEEDVGEEYFSILLQRCFFQDMVMDEHGEIYSVKMHDLIHDLTQVVAGKESCLVMDTSTSHLNKKIHHVSVAVRHSLLPCAGDTLGKMRIMRTLLQLQRPGFDDEVFCESDVAIILANCRHLRVLDLSRLHIRSLGNSLNNLLHLRYLDLSFNRDLERLPKSISKLYNLQVLKLKYCVQLKELPEDLRELVNLRHLDISGCDALTHMPAGMGSLINLNTLSTFVLGGGSSNQVHIGQLRELMPLNNLRGELKIQFRESYSYDATNAEEGSYLLSKKHIKALVIKGAKYETPIVLDERLLEVLQPHHDLILIKIYGYKSIRLPGWVAAIAANLPRLVRICLERFERLQHLPQLSQLQHLKILQLDNMPGVEYMEDDKGNIPCFPLLEELILWNFPKLKGWWRPEVGVETDGVIPGLHKLTIFGCPNLTSFPGIPHVKEKRANKFNPYW